MKKKIFNKHQSPFILLFLILLIAAILRFYNLSSVPPGASLDEASIGWNAYSILHTGKDEYGYKFPILLRAFDDWRPALYVYFVIPFVKVIGLTTLAVRLPSVLLSLLTIISSYFLIKILFKDYEYKNSLSLLVSFLLAISPWNIYISRLGHEVNAGLFFVVSGILFFLLSINDKKKKTFLIFSSILFGFSFYTYQSVKIFTPFIILTLILIYRKQLLQMKKIFLYPTIIGVMIAAPIVIASFSPNALIRFKGSSVFDTNNPLYAQSAKQLLVSKEKGDFLGIILNNRRVTSLNIFISQYFSHFSPKWIFSNTGNESFKTPGLGLLYYWETPFFFLGIIFLFKSKISPRTKLVIFFWILISFIAPAITTGAPHAMRSYNIIPMPIILTSFGILGMGRFISKKIGFPLLGLVVVIELFYFFHQYFFIFPKTQSSSFQYSLSEVMPFIAKNHNKYEKIIISNQGSLYQSYMFYLFYNKYDPKKYLEEGGTVSGGYAETHKFNKYIFRPINYKKDRLEKNTLLVGNPSDFSQDIRALTEFRNLDGKISVEMISKK